MKRLVVVADDFGSSPTINQAILEAHERGIVTAASLMAGGDAFEDAVRNARARPDLSVGLHATLCDGRPVLPPSRIPGIARAGGRFDESPARAGFSYGLRWARVRGEIEQELSAQLDRLTTAGIAPAHVDGHHHLHVHPPIFRLLCREAARRGVRWVRVPQGDRSGGRVAEWALFAALDRVNRPAATRYGLRAADRVHGLSRTGRIDEAYLIGLMPRIAAGWNELFVHPDTGTEAGRRELQAVTSVRVGEAIEKLGIVLTGYHEGSDRTPVSGRKEVSK